MGKLSKYRARFIRIVEPEERTRIGARVFSVVVQVDVECDDMEEGMVQARKGMSYLREGLWKDERFRLKSFEPISEESTVQQEGESTEPGRMAPWKKEDG